MDSIPAKKGPLDTWLVDLSGNVAVCGVGVAFLDDQITKGRIDAKRLWEELRGTRQATTGIC